MCQARPEALCEGLDPVVSQHHSLRQTQVELILQAQNHTVDPRYWEQLLQQLSKLLLRMVWSGEECDQDADIPDIQDIPSGTELNKQPQNVLGWPAQGGSVFCWWKKHVGLTWQINIGGPVASLMFEGADASTMKSTVFTLWVCFLWKHGQQTSRKRQPAGNRTMFECSLHVMFPVWANSWIV